MASSTPPTHVGSDVQNNNFIMSDPYLDVDDFADCAVDNSYHQCPESTTGFKDFQEEFDFKVRSRWRRPSFITGLCEDYVPTTNRIVAMNMGSAEDIHEYDSGLTMERTTSYHVSAALSTDTSGLIDGGANGGLANPKEMKLIAYSDPTRFIHITGVGDLRIPKLKIGTYASKVQLQDGRFVLMIFHEYGELPSGRTIHSKIQLADNGCTIHDHPQMLGGEQCIKTVEGHKIPLDFENGLPYIKMQYPSEEDMKLPHVVMTRDIPWNPSQYDKNLSGEVTDYDPVDSQQPLDVLHPNFNQFGELITARYGEMNPDEWDATVDLLSVSMSYQRRVDTTGEVLPDMTDPIHCAFHLGFNAEMHTEIYQCYAMLGNLNMHYASQTMAPIEYQDMRKYFLNVPTSTVRSTFDSTTRYYRFIPSTNKFMTYRSPYPALNVFRRHELVYTDTVFSNVSAWGGIKAAQVFAGKMSKYISVHPCKTDADFPRCLEDEIRKRGAMDRLASDRARAEISNKVKDIVRTLFIDTWQSEPHFHHQNFVERMIQELKKFTNWVLNWSDAPPEAWYETFEYVCFIMNRTAKESLNWRTPVEALTGQTPDISMLLHFIFWEPVFIKNYQGSGKKSFPSASNEIIVRFIGYAEDIGHSCTFKVFNEDTNEILYRSALRKVDPDTDTLNVPPFDPKPLDDMDDDAIEDVVNTRSMDDPALKRTAMFSPEELIGRTFLMKQREDGTRDRATIIGVEQPDTDPSTDPLDDFEELLDQQRIRTKFKVKVGSTQFEEYVGWSDMCDFIEEQIQHEDQTWNFRKIVGHKTGQTKREIPEILILWESGEITYEPITEICKADAYLVAEYALEKKLLDQWHKRCPKLKLKQKAANTNKMMRMINAAKMESYRNTPIYMFGVKVPRNHQQAVKFDEENGNRLWQEAEEKEINQMFEYNVFDDRGHRSVAEAPEGYKKINLHLVYACKHDGRRKARIVAGGHLTDEPVESVYSGVVSLRGIRLLVFLSELNDLEVYQTDIGNAFLEAKTNEKVYVIAGGEFGERKDHVFVIVGSLYGLKTSAKRFHEVLSDVIREMGFRPCHAEPDIWMRAMNSDGTVMTAEEIKREDPAYTYKGVEVPIFDGYYEYIATYVDDLTIGSKNPKAIISYLEDVAKFKLKGSEPIKYLLGCDYWRDDDGTLCAGPKQYIEKMNETYFRLFGERPKPRKTPLDPNSHPELDTTEFCSPEDTKIYQSLIGALQWATSLGRFDVSVHVMTLGSFRAQPREGHLEAVKNIYGYLTRMKEGTIRYRTDMPNLSDMEFEEYDWSRTVYAGSTEEYPSNLPAARGKPVQLLTYKDANLYHDMLSGKAVTALLHMLNQTPIDWFSKKQATVETATFGSENVAARTAIEQMKTLKYTLLYLGVPIMDKSILVGDNKTVVDSTTQPHSRLARRHLMLSYHYVKEAIATGKYAFVWIDGKDNPADVLSKHWSFGSVWSSLQPLLFWHGNTLDCPPRLKS